MTHLTRLQRDVLTLMEEAGRPLIRFTMDGGRHDFYCGQSAGNHVHAWTANGLIRRGLVSLDPERSDPQHYWINDRGREALDHDAPLEHAVATYQKQKRGRAGADGS